MQYSQESTLLETLFNKVKKVYNFIKKRLEHRGFPVNIATFLRTPTLKNICEQLLLSSYTHIAQCNSRGCIEGDQWHEMGKNNSLFIPVNGSYGNRDNFGF